MILPLQRREHRLFASSCSQEATPGQHQPHQLHRSPCQGACDLQYTALKAQRRPLPHLWYSAGDDNPHNKASDLEGSLLLLAPLAQVRQFSGNVSQEHGLFQSNFYILYRWSTRCIVECRPAEPVSACWKHPSPLQM